jgi:hypothetical protein
MQATKIVDDLLKTINRLVQFEELLSAYYRIGARQFGTQGDFWQSAAMAKETRASLFTNLRLDLEANTEKFSLKKNMGGTYLARLNQLRDNLVEIRENRLPEDKFIRFALDIESFLHRSQEIPLVVGTTDESAKVNRLVSSIQDTQVRLISSYVSYKFKTLKPAVKPAEAKKTATPTAQP